MSRPTYVVISYCIPGKPLLLQAKELAFTFAITDTIKATFPAILQPVAQNGAFKQIF
jgi:hypothetical protein